MRKLLVFALGVTVWGCGKKVQVEGPKLVERDRDLYEAALKDMEKSRYTTARLSLEVLMATYQDSEFAPQAKYARAESFYREGGTSGYQSAEIEFKDFITFFPDNELADDAQLMVAMTHVKQLEKPDRDDTEARLAEYELLEMIKLYPKSPLLNEAKEKLREVQEVRAEGIFGPARQYFLRRAYPAVIDRCEEVLEKYPDFSGTDHVLFLLAQSEEKIADSESATTHYAQIVRDFPTSERVKDAKRALVALKSPIPDPDPLAMNRIQQ